jgi:lipopolysaccharide cholinephosphotransferase
MESDYLKLATLKDLQIEMLKLLQMIDRICKDNDIEYWLDASTLLGAVRHKGFIFWNSNCGICVPANEYLRLISALDVESTANADIFLFYEHNDIPRGLFEKLATTKIMLRNDGKLYAGHIHISPVRFIKKIDKQKDAEIISVGEYFHSGDIAMHGVKVDKKYIKKNLKSALAEKEKFTQYIHFEYFSDCNNRGSENLVRMESLDYYHDFNTYLSYVDIFPLKKIFFEGIEFFAPNNASKYLKTLYGDYMKLPPKLQQTPKRSDELFLCSSIQFAKESTANSLMSDSQSFYHFSIRRFLASMARRVGIFESLKGLDIAIKKLKNFIIKNGS